MTATAHRDRGLVRRAVLLQAGLVAYNLAEGAVSVIAGLLAGSVVLVGFGFDSAVEVSAAVVVLVHLVRSGDEVQPAWERRVAVFVGITLLSLAVYVAGRSVFNLANSVHPSDSYVGIAVTAASLCIMPLAALLQHRLARGIGSLALDADARETLVCTYLSATALLGLAAHALLGWWWADSLAGLVLVVLIAREGREVLMTRELVCIDED